MCLRDPAKSPVPRVTDVINEVLMVAARGPCFVFPFEPLIVRRLVVIVIAPTLDFPCDTKIDIRVLCEKLDYQCMYINNKEKGEINNQRVGKGQHFFKRFMHHFLHTFTDKCIIKP